MNVLLCRSAIDWSFLAIIMWNLHTDLTDLTKDLLVITFLRRYRFFVSRNKNFDMLQCYILACLWYAETTGIIRCQTNSIDLNTLIPCPSLREEVLWQLQMLTGTLWWSDLLTKVLFVTTVCYSVERKYLNYWTMLLSLISIILCDVE